MHNFFLPTLPVFTAFTLNEIVAHLETCSPTPLMANTYACNTHYSVHLYNVGGIKCEIRDLQESYLIFQVPVWLYFEKMFHDAVKQCKHVQMSAHILRSFFQLVNYEWGHSYTNEWYSLLVAWKGSRSVKYILFFHRIISAHWKYPIFLLYFQSEIQL